MTTGTYTRFAFFAALAVLASHCASQPHNPVAIRPDADPSQELAMARSELTALRSQQADVVAEKSFERATKAYDEAVARRADGKSSEDINEKIALSRGHAADIRARLTRVQPDLTGVLANREAALRQRVAEFEPGKLNDADEKLGDLADDLDRGDRDKLAERADELNRAYIGIEGKTAVQQRLAKSRADLDAAKKEGASRLVPVTLKQAELDYEQASKAIEASPRSTAVVEAAERKSTEQSAKLLSLTRRAKSVQEGSPEQEAVRAMEQTAMVESMRASTQLAEERAEQASRDATGAQGRAEQASREAVSAEERAAQAIRDKNQTVEAKAAKVREQFTTEEAEVYTEGKDVLVRLKGLQFPSNQAVIRPEQYPLLKKLRDSMAEVDPATVLVEGHTDSIGAKTANESLSLKRADAVKGYLLSTDVLSDSQIQTKGFGFQSPLTSNKTPSGRAMNRRIDVRMQTK